MFRFESFGKRSLSRFDRKMQRSFFGFEFFLQKPRIVD